MKVWAQHTRELGLQIKICQSHYFCLSQGLSVVSASYPSTSTGGFHLGVNDLRSLSFIRLNLGDVGGSGGEFLPRAYLALANTPWESVGLHPSTAPCLAFDGLLSSSAYLRCIDGDI